MVDPIQSTVGRAKVLYRVEMVQLVDALRQWLFHGTQTRHKCHFLQRHVIPSSIVVWTGCSLQYLAYDIGYASARQRYVLRHMQSWM